MRIRIPVGVICLASAIWAQRVGVPTTDLDKVSVDELFQIEVTSVGRKAQKLAKAPAAVFVLTAADIHRSGAASIPEALQLVPGLTVMRLDGRSWVVSARGGARLFSDKMLVMIDGRSLYTPFFSGVIWDTVDIPMEDVEQIEIVRGPGAVMWGPNAVNGVINIITRNSRNTKGGQAAVSTGTERKASAEARYGGGAGERFSWRGWGKFDFLTPAFHSPGYYNDAGFMLYRRASLDNLDSATGRVGFRMDGQPSETDQWMLEGELFKTDRQDPLATSIVYPVLVVDEPGHSDYLGGSVQGKWTHTRAPGNERTVQFSFDRTNIDFPSMGGTLNNLNLNLEWRRQTGERNEIYWGGGFQRYWDDTMRGKSIAYSPAKGSYMSGDIVLRDEYQLIPGRLTASAGLRLDYNSYHTLEHQPSARLLYTPNLKQSAWVAVSRAVRVPNRLDRDFDEDAGMAMVGGMPVALRMYGSRTMRSETERSVETGYRFQSGQRWSVDFSLFRSSYGRLRGEFGSSQPAIILRNGLPTFSLPITTCNCGAGRSYGGEFSGMWQVRHGWRLSPAYWYMEESRHLPANGVYSYRWDGNPTALRHQAVIRSQHDIGRNLQLDLTARARSGNEDLYRIPGVLLLDARVAWKPSRNGELSFKVNNLTGREVLEGFPELTNAAIPLRRMYVLKWTQRF